MGSNRKLVFGALFIVAGLIFWGLYHFVSNGSSVTPTPAPAVSQIALKPASGQIAYAKFDIPQGSIITKGMLGMRDAPSGGLTTGFVTNLDDEALGFITRVPISKNATIRPADDFVGHITETGIAGALRSGYRALVIPIANKPTLHDLVKIGNFIDINSAFDAQEARTIVPNIRVLAVDVFGSDYPQTNIAVRGPFKADPIGATTVAAPVAPGAPAPTPTATPGPQQAPPRPDPSITVEVTPAQANTILLAQASGGVIDFTVLPAVPGGQLTTPTIVDGQDAAGITTVSDVTRAQIAPHAEAMKHVAPPRAPSAPSSNNGSTTRTTKYTGPDHFPGPVPPTPPFPVAGSEVPPASQTYEIPVYADGKLVRSDSVLRPQ